MKHLAPDKVFQHCLNNAIGKHEAEDKKHAIRASGGAYERAIIVLRMLIGETEWTDGWERPLDDCFEMNDGDEVCAWLLEFGDGDPRIKAFIAGHRNVGAGCLASWEKHRGKHREKELALA